jgi:hypothetical protein
VLSLLLFGIDRIEMSHQQQSVSTFSRTAQKLMLSKTGIFRRNAFLRKAKLSKLAGDEFCVAQYACAITRETVDRHQPTEEVQCLRETALDY